MIEKIALGETILVDKPIGWTSFDVVNKIRWHLKRKLGVKKIKVGHAGTLDPLATGLLVICIGANTKKINKYMIGDKRYVGKFLVGKTTSSYDLETDFNGEFPISHINEDLIESVRLSFFGKQYQEPPVFSAKKIKGKRAYDYARSGIDVELTKNKIIVHDFKIDSSNFPEINFDILCSKGTYIRKIAHDFGSRLNSGATLIELRRLQSGTKNVSESRSIDDWIDFIDNSPL